MSSNRLVKVVSCESVVPREGSPRPADYRRSKRAIDIVLGGFLLLLGLPLLLVATVWYVILTSIVSIAQYYVERYYSRGALRTLPLTPLQKLRSKIANLRAHEIGNAW